MSADVNDPTRNIILQNTSEKYMTHKTGLLSCLWLQSTQRSESCSKAAEFCSEASSESNPRTDGPQETIDILMGL